jgi:hypothetical protein
MRGRSAALAIAGVLVLAGMIAMRCSLASTDETPSPPPPSTAQQPAAPSAAPPAPVATPSAAPPAPVAPPPTGPAVTASPSAPQLPEPVEPAAPAVKHPPIAPKGVLRDQVAAVEPQVIECGKQAAGSGVRANGTAVLTYMVTPDKKKQEVAIEQTGVEYDGTTIDNQPLLDCLKDTSKDMKFKYVPDTDGVFALRRVKFTDGKLVENSFINFHYVR